MLRDIVDNNALLLRYNERELDFVRMAYGYPMRAWYALMFYPYSKI